ncbi:hypothetical protein D3C80_1017960 [compost metagenome]
MFRTYTENQRCSDIDTNVLDWHRHTIAVRKHDRNAVCIECFHLNINEVHCRRAYEPCNELIDRMMIEFKR